MTAQEFKQLWEDDPEDRLMAYPASLVEMLQIPHEDKGFLAGAGLPESAPPFLSFRAPNKCFESVSDGWKLSGTFSRYRQLGSNCYGDPICLDEDANGAIVCLNHEDDFRRIFMNTGVSFLCASLVAYRELVRKTLKRGGEDAFLDGEVEPQDIKDAFSDLYRIDAAATEPDCFWTIELESLSQP